MSHTFENLLIVVSISLISASFTFRFIFFPFKLTSVDSNIKHANFQLLSFSAIPSSKVKSENQAVPLACPAFPPSLKPKLTVSLSSLLKINSIFCHSVVP